jgi:single-strand DNA-binding protein
MNIAVWGKQGENCATYLDKGSPLLVTGRIQMREFTDAEGKKTSTYEIVAEHVKWLSAPNKEHENIVSNADVPTSEDEDDTEF